MKKIIFVFIVLLNFILLNASPVLAQTTALDDAKAGLQVSATNATLTNGTSSDIRVIVVNIVGYVLSLVGIIFLILIIISGIQWMTAGGNEDNVKKAKKTIINSAIGMLIIGAAYIITNNVFTLIGDYIK